MTISLRPYQVKALDAVAGAEKEGVRRPLIVHPTGTGKTVTFAEMIRRRAYRGRAIILVHREELANQAQEKLSWIAPDLSTGIVKAERDELDADVVIASVPTVHRDARLARLVDSAHRSAFGIVVADEAHHAPAPSWVKTMKALGSFNPYGPLTVGVTATPERDGKTLGVWEQVVAYMSIREAIYGTGGDDGGYLAPILPAVVVETEMDMGRIRKGSGESGYSDTDTGTEMERSGAIDQIADAYVQHASDRKAIAFTPTVKTAHALADALRQRGVPAAALDGETDKEIRKQILAQLKSGAIRVVVNCNVLTEGFDEPSIDCVIVARPTRFHGLYVQMVGRGTRLHPGKKNLLIIDVVGASNRHELIGAVDLGLDIDDPRKKKEGETEQLACPSCGVPCEFAEHRCQLCHRYLPVTRLRARRHENCAATKGGKVDVFGTSRMRWLPLPGGAWCLGAKNEVLVMVPNQGDSWRLASYRPNKLEILHTEIPPEWAMGIGEDRVKAFVKLSERSASWHRLPVSDLQRGKLIREGFPAGSLRKLGNRGEASDLLARIQGRRALKRMGLPV